MPNRAPRRAHRRYASSKNTTPGRDICARRRVGPGGCTDHLWLPMPHRPTGHRREALVNKILFSPWRCTAPMHCGIVIVRQKLLTDNTCAVQGDAGDARQRAAGMSPPSSSPRPSSSAPSSRASSSPNSRPRPQRPPRPPQRRPKTARKRPRRRAAPPASRTRPTRSVPHSARSS